MSDSTEAERLQKLSDRMKEHRLLTEQRKAIHSEHQRATRKLKAISTKIASVGQAIYQLKHNGITPTVTDHAIVRYLERVKGMDIDEIRIAVAKDNNAVKVGNVIVTVNEEFTE